MKKIYYFTLFLLIVLIAFGNNVAADEDSDSSDNSGSDSQAESDAESARQQAESDAESERQQKESDTESARQQRESDDKSKEKIREELKEREEKLREEAKSKEERIREEANEEREIEVEIEKGLVKVKIEINGKEQEFEISEFENTEDIINEIVARTGLTFEEVSNIIEIEIEEEEIENEIEIKIKNGVAEVKTEINGEKTRFVLENTNREEVLLLVAERLGVSVERLLAFAEIEIEEKTKVTNELGEIVEIEFESKNGEIKKKIKVKNKIAETELELEEEVEDGKSKLKAKLSNGNFYDIKIMPDRASEVALGVLESKGVNLELKEVGNEEKRAVYEARVEKQGRILGLFRARAELSTRIDPDTGEVLEVKRPWWFFLVNNAEEVAEGSTGVTGTVLAGEQPVVADEDLAAV